MIAGEKDVKAYSPENSGWEYTYYSLTNRPVCEPEDPDEPSKQHRDPLLGYHCATSNPMDRAVAWVLMWQATLCSDTRYKIKG